MDDIRLETYFGLIAQDLDAQRTVAEVKSHKCSENARCRTAKSPAKPSTVTRKTVCESVQVPANAEEGPTDAWLEYCHPNGSEEETKLLTK